MVAVGDQPKVTEQTLHVALAMPEDEARESVARGFQPRDDRIGEHR
jgi:hypothetical protein